MSIIDVDQVVIPKLIFYNDPTVINMCHPTIERDDFVEGEKELEELNTQIVTNTPEVEFGGTKKREEEDMYVIVETTGFDYFKYQPTLHESDIQYFMTHYKNASDFINQEIQKDIIDVNECFKHINRMMFRDHITNTTIEWSKRMTSCAGICYGKPNGCVIRLSQGILSYRPTKDTVTTLVHESVHAHLFRTHTRDDDSHGTRFHEWMTVINEHTCLNVTVFHTFFDECNNLKKHVWRCDGTCRDKPPFYGYVKRSMNRAPGPNDFWYKKHQETCGGKFIKISGPEKETKFAKEKKPRKSTKKSVQSDLKKIFDDMCQNK
ncbi:hypothetical protein EIN_403040 [Entamoeba invadens IP1]|uniref:SprT-like domain-containing protein n=1 Tax=Entamoeba invadens IP1 TaxID=370355 RepID=A0A0A1U6P7_ENTIV|nr:hypothetical protein EIN_403040 [Entamoeba invadens IP1]ELP89990.1 hypothetical protein EIN_403040 [Entamoeba invadens IP1]|eukprot:XP_004256761.1 hypothetical protein EIN_403040 [Entamoeba invadens IP1]